jgi:hypothetical protein
MSTIYTVEAYDKRRDAWEPVAIGPEPDARETARLIRLGGQEARVRCYVAPRPGWGRRQRARRRW